MQLIFLELCDICFYFVFSNQIKTEINTISKAVVQHYTIILTYKASKRIFARRNKTALGPRKQAETYLKFEDLRSNKNTGKLS